MSESYTVTCGDNGVIAPIVSGVHCNNTCNGAPYDPADLDSLNMTSDFVEDWGYGVDAFIT